MFWSTNIQPPPISVNGLVIDHPEGYFYGIRRSGDVSDEIIKLT